MKIFAKKREGFTLIELLVVIAIIGILASIVLVSLSGARDRAKDARIMADMGQIRSTAEIFYGNTGAYTSVCTATDTNALWKDIDSQGGAASTCTSISTAYCCEVRLNSGAYWCVDSALRSKQYSSNPTCTSGSVYTCE
jgi:prepilin-type N-terminal cleavage/methylation domain-containing protein